MHVGAHLALVLFMAAIMSLLWRNFTCARTVALPSCFTDLIPIVLYRNDLPLGDVVVKLVLYTLRSAILMIETR